MSPQTGATPHEARPAPLLLLSLACSGLPQSIIEGATGGGVSVGDNAEFPADFPLPAPPPGSGTIMNVVKTETGDQKSITIMYQLAESAPDLIAYYQDAMQKKGITVTRSTSEGSGASSDSLVAQDGSIVVTVSAAYTQRTLTMVWNRM